MPDVLESTIARILKEYSNIAVVGASQKADRPSHIVMSYLIMHGYHIIPVNPGYERILDRKTYADLMSIPEKVDVVNIFRRSEEVLPIVEQAIAIGAKAVWMQEGVFNQDASALAKAAGLLVVMNRCMKKEHERLQQVK